MDSINKIKEFFKNNKWIVVFALAIPFFNDSYVPIQGILDQFMDQYKLLSFLALIVIMFAKKRKPSLLAIVLVLFETWWYISTLINYPLSESIAFYKTSIDIIDALSMALIVECFIDDPGNLIKGLILNLELAVYPNFVTVVLQNIPGDRYYLIGFYAVLIIWLIPAICVGALHILLNKGYLRGSLLIIFSIATAVIVTCATTTVALLAMAGFVVLGVLMTKIKFFKEKKLPLSIFVAFSFASLLFVLFVYSGGSFPIIDFFIEKVLRRATHFTGRIHIWKAAIEMIKEKPIIGHGYRVDVTTVYNFTVIHCHNQLLQVLNVRGIIGLIIALIFHFVLCKKIDSSKNTIERLILSGAVFGICMTYITEAYKKFFRFYLVFFLAYYVDELIKDKYRNTDYLLK